MFVHLNFNTKVERSLFRQNKTISLQVLTIFDASRVEKLRNLARKTTNFCAGAQNEHYLLDENMSVHLNFKTEVKICFSRHNYTKFVKVWAIFNACSEEKVWNLTQKRTYFDPELKMNTIFWKKTLKVR